MTTELELRDRLADAASDAPDQLGLSLAELRRRGRRRQRTRIGVTSAAAGLVAAGLVAGGSAVHLSGSAADLGKGGGPAVVGAPGPSVSVAWPPAPGSTAPEILSVDPSQIIDTTDSVGGGTLAFWFGEQNDRFIMVLGLRAADGTRQVLGVTNDPDVLSPGPGAAGFHAGWETVPGDRRVLLGYVVGDVATVTLTVDGTPATANVRTWPHNQAVHVWWVLVPNGTGDQAKVTDLKATDAAGTVVASVPDGGTAVG